MFPGRNRTKNIENGQSPIEVIQQAFFWTFRKKLKAKITQAEKKLKQIFEKLK